PVKKNLPFEVKEFQRIELDARKLRSRREFWIRPLFGPIRADKDDRAFRNFAVAFFPIPNVVHAHLVTGIFGHFVLDGYHHQGPDCVGGRQFVDCRIVRIPMSGRVELRSKLIGREIVMRGLETIFLVGVWPIRGWIHGRKELRWSKTMPNRNGGADSMSQIHVFCTLERLIIDIPQRSALRLPIRQEQGASEHNKNCANCFPTIHRYSSVSIGDALPVWSVTIAANSWNAHVAR